MTETKILLTVPAELKKEFQLACIRNDSNMSDTIRQLMQDYVEKHETDNLK